MIILFFACLFSHFTCVSFSQAVTACQREKFDIIFMDICMPNMNGIDATRTIRTDPSSANQTTPIIAFAGNAGNE